MDRIVNFNILSNPLNWVIVALMLAFAAFALSLLMQQGGAYMPGTGTGSGY